MQGNGHLRRSAELAVERHEAFGELLNRQEKSRLVDHGVVRSTVPGEFLCRPHQIDTRSYLLAVGEVEVRDRAEMKSTVLARLGWSGLFGEIAALFCLPRISAIRVSQPSVLLAISGDTLEKVISGRAELYDAVWFSVISSASRIPHYAVSRCFVMLRQTGWSH
ncbi:cyclic nucleotide-binding domain-containing protein [Thiohalophilus thiocyanatoxydans]|uniref:cyclic nucleotide-binding domain-containing protein n=1 Tax=Thiohalophilus thiocyanatoxydans TaxID=381308 RepID=UPI001064C5A6|nr:cyclic nucleotide-binding domain-containing protein [Thiohalophilus thiocyanatoxydans]